MYVAYSVLKIWQTVTGSINQVRNLDTLQAIFAYNCEKKSQIANKWSVVTSHWLTVEVFSGFVANSPPTNIC